MKSRGGFFRERGRAEKERDWERRGWERTERERLGEKRKREEKERKKNILGALHSTLVIYFVSHLLPPKTNLLYKLIYIIIIIMIN